MASAIIYFNAICQRTLPLRPRITILKRFKSTDSVSPQSYCLNLVRSHDYENFLCSLLLSSNVRSTALAVRGFNVEISKVQDQVSEPRLAQMRLQFWHDTLENLFKDVVPQHPVAQDLYEAIQRHKLKKHHLRSLVSARISQLPVASFPSLEAVEKHAESSVTPVYYLLLQAAGVQNVHADHAASHLGKAQGLANMVRAVPHHSVQRAVVLPRDLLAQHGVVQESLLRGSRDQPVKDVIFEVAARAKQHLDKARSMKEKVPKEVNTLFLPAVAVSSYLDSLQKLDFDVFHPNLQRRNQWLPWTLFVNKFLNRY